MHVYYGLLFVVKNTQCNVKRSRVFIHSIGYDITNQRDLVGSQMTWQVSPEAAVGCCSLIHL